MPKRTGFEDRKAPLRRKRAVNLSADATLVAAAQAAGINLSAAFEDAIAARLRQTMQERALAELKPAMDWYNDYVARHGSLSDQLRGR